MFVQLFRDEYAYAVDLVGLQWELSNDKYISKYIITIVNNNIIKNLIYSILIFYKKRVEFLSFITIKYLFAILGVTR